MSGEMMGTEGLLQRIDEVVKGLTSIKDKKILEWASNEDWSVGIGISLLNDYKDIINIDKKRSINPMIINENKNECFCKEDFDIMKESTVDVTNEFLKSEIQSMVETIYNGKVYIDTERINEIVDLVINDDQIWDNFNNDLKDIIEQYVSIKNLDKSDSKIPHMYEDFSMEKKYTWDVFELKEDGTEVFLDRYIKLPLDQVIYLLLSGMDPNSYELDQTDEFEDWYYLRDNKNNVLYRIQLFQ